MLLKSILIASYGTSFGLKEIESYYQLTSKKHSQFLQRLNKAGFASPLLSYANIGEIVNFKNNGGNESTLGWNDFEVIKVHESAGRAFQISGGPIEVINDKPGNISVKARQLKTWVMSLESYYPGGGRLLLMVSPKILNVLKINLFPSMFRQAIISSDFAINRSLLQSDWGYHC